MRLCARRRVSPLQCTAGGTYLPPTFWATRSFARASATASSRACISSGGDAAIVSLDRLQERDAEQAQTGVVQGMIDGAPDDHPVVVAVNGTIVTGSPQFDYGDESQMFAAILPSGG